MFKITTDILRKIVPTLTDQRAAALVPLINEMCAKYKIDGPKRFSAIISNLAHESGGFRLREENLNYSVSGLRRVFSKYFPTARLANKYANRPREIANIVYGGRMGNVAADDGWMNRGGGFIQITGKDMYMKFAAYCGIPMDEIADLVRNTDRWAMESAFWLFTVEKKLGPIADAMSFSAIVKAINGGYNGLAERRAYYDRSLAVFGLKAP